MDIRGLYLPDNEAWRIVSITASRFLLLPYRPRTSAKMRTSTIATNILLVRALVTLI